MAAFVFPLMIKLKLEREGLYRLTEDDRIRCLVVDKLLGCTDWQAPGESRPNPQNKWNTVLHDIKHEISIQRAVEFMNDFRRTREESMKADPETE
jgi:hypothetical protein